MVIHPALPADPHETIIDSIAGEVAWTSPLPDGTHYAVGIRFDNMKVERPRLYAHIKHLEKMS